MMVDTPLQAIPTLTVLQQTHSKESHCHAYLSNRYGRRRLFGRYSPFVEMQATLIHYSIISTYCNLRV